MAHAPRAEVDVTVPLVRDLLAAQHPDLLIRRDLVPFAEGWDNVMLRLGTDLLVRLPRRAVAVDLLQNEQRWLPELQRVLPATVPVPVRVGAPSGEYPWPWSVLTWTPGMPVGMVSVHDRRPLAEPLAEFFAALHRPAPADAPRNPVRGGALTSRAAAFRERLPRLPEPALLADVFDDAVAVDLSRRPGLWGHGDPHPFNLLADGRRLAAVIDWGDVTVGDPASDLATAWLTFDENAHARFRSRYDALAAHGLDVAALWRRARGWAVHLGAILAVESDDRPDLRAVGEHALARLRRESATAG
ncbi:aminoglycoside phosphotransferase family protein [Microbacterium gorillae]|uniref:aminoglycoside phosphotransferase family protein n=1 Tax=Microbacterium gorillae TaxID=1231063 RepID=UPI0005902ABA|nr:aminoglycoside phosphotransferase family protein [Microbacterium gorillae]